MPTEVSVTSLKDSYFERYWYKKIIMVVTDIEPDKK